MAAPRGSVHGAELSVAGVHPAPTQPEDHLTGFWSWRELEALVPFLLCAAFLASKMITDNK
jgi:hypothetical protein